VIVTPLAGADEHIAVYLDFPNGEFNSLTLQRIEVGGSILTDQEQDAMWECEDFYNEVIEGAREQWDIA